MSVSLRVALLLVIVLSMASFRAHAQADDRTLLQFAHRSWGIKEGAPSSIWEIAQTNDGFLWLAGPFGLVRFDGMSFQRFQSSTGDTLPDKGVSALYASPEGGLWIGYRAGGVAYIKGDRAIAYLKPQERPISPVFAFVTDLDGTVWAAHGNGLARRTAKGWQQVGKDWNFTADIAPTLFLDRAGTLWVGTQRSVVFLPRGAHQFQATTEHLSSTDQFLQDAEGAIWVVAVSDASVHKVRIGNSTNPASGKGVPLSGAQALFDRHGALWVATPGDGLYRTRKPSELAQEPEAQAKRSLEHFSALNGLTADLGYSVFEDREGNIWMGTSSGLDRFSRRDIVPVPLPPGHEGFSLAAGDHGDVWVTSLTKSIAHIDGEQISFHPEGSGAKASYRDPSGTIWWGQERAIVRYADGKFTSTPFPKGTPIVSVFTITSRDDGLWVAMELGEPFRLQNGVWSQPGAQLGLPPHLHPLFSHTDSAGRMCMSYTRLGIYCLDHGRVSSYPATGPLDIGAVLSMGGDGTDLFVGGETGLAGYNGSSFVRLQLASDQTLNSVVGLAESTDGDLWLSDADGVVTIPKAEVSRALRDPRYRVQSRSFDYSDGLPSTPQLARPLSTMIRASDGRIWFATDSAPAWIDPHHLLRNAVAPEVSISRLTADGKSYDTHSAVTLPIGTNAIGLRYTAPSLSAPERVMFRYRLSDARHSEWQPATVRREANFTNLSPGTYRFEVTASNEDGVLSPKAAVVDFVVQPRFYQTKLFLGSAALVGALLLWALHRLRLYQLSQRMRARLDDRVAERERIARELHDTFLQGLYGLVCQLEVVRRNSSAQTSVHSTLSEALDGADKMLAEGRGRIMQLRITTADNLPEAIELLCAEQARQQSRHIVFRTEGVFRSFAPSVHDEIYRICAEALANACQHSEAATIEVSLEYSPRQLRLSVRDDGVGMDPAVLESRHKGGHWGLPGMFERAHTIDAQLTIRNLEPHGVEVVLIVHGARPGSSLRRLLG